MVEIFSRSGIRLCWNFWGSPVISDMRSVSSSSNHPGFDVVCFFGLSLSFFVVFLSFIWAGVLFFVVVFVVSVFLGLMRSKLFLMGISGLVVELSFLGLEVELSFFSSVFCGVSNVVVDVVFVGVVLVEFVFFMVILVWFLDERLVVLMSLVWFLGDERLLGLLVLLVLVWFFFDESELLSVGSEIFFLGLVMTNSSSSPLDSSISSIFLLPINLEELC